MGLLSSGKPLKWADTESLADYVRGEGVEQFLVQYGRNKDRQGDNLVWGDEIEYVMVEFDEARQQCHLYIHGAVTLEELEKAFPDGEVIWHPEFARYMLESTPGKPYDHSLAGMLQVEAQMKLRRAQAESVLGPNRKLISCSSFPRLGLADSFPRDAAFTNACSQSKYFPDEAINPHPRFATLVENIRTRRGKKVVIEVPIFQDKHTDLADDVDAGALFPGAPDGSRPQSGAVYMDHMGFGMGCCCLQITMQAFSLDESRKIYDQLVPFAPIAVRSGALLVHPHACRWP